MLKYIMEVEVFMIQVSCGAIVYRKVEGGYLFLVVQNILSKSFGFPKGHVEANESFKQTAIREVFEETGINIQIVQEHYYTSKYSFYARWSKQSIQKEVHIFLAEAINFEIIPQVEEVLYAEWLSASDVLSILTHDNDVQMFLLALSELKS